MGLVFLDLACSNCSLGQAAGTLGIARQHHPSDKYTYQLPACACTLIVRLSVSFRLSCLKPFTMHTRSRSSASSTRYFQGIFISITCIMHLATFRWVVAHIGMFYIVRMVVKSMNIIGTYEVIQTRCRSSVSYSPCVTEVCVYDSVGT